MASRVCNLFKFLILYLFLNLNLIVNADSDDDEEGPPSPRIILKTALGDLEGTEEIARGGRKFYQFRGVKYGEIPKRFMEALPANQKWVGKKDATDFGPSCLQAGAGEEDCLYLNVYTPYLPNANKPKMAVLFFIHGGAFIIGSGKMYGAEYWMDEDIIIVTINYRLSVMGFLNLDLDEAPGNQGLKDQLLALQWVQENIHDFNGDKSRVTIFGESAGAASVSYQILSPISKGLFHGGISQSGTAVCPWALHPRPVSQSMILARQLNCAKETTTKEEILKCLVEKDAAELMEAMRYDMVPQDLNEDISDSLTALSFIPSVETRKPSPKSSIFLPKLPMEILKEREFQNVPWIVGANDIEGFLFQSALNLKTMKSVEEIKAEWERVAPAALKYNDRPKAEQDSITESIRKFYFDNRIDVKKNATNLCSDRMFFFCSKLAAELYSQKSSVYLYYFEKVGGFSVMSFFTGAEKPPGPTHADELAFQWKLISPVIESSTADIPPGHNLYNVSREFISMWAHFAQNGKPKTVWNSKPIGWDPVPKDAPKNPKWLHLNDEAQFLEESTDFQERMKFWRESALEL